MSRQSFFVDRKWILGTRVLNRRWSVVDDVTLVPYYRVVYGMQECDVPDIKFGVRALNVPETGFSCKAEPDKETGTPPWQYTVVPGAIHGTPC